MANTIVTKFTIGTEHGINTVLSIGAATAREKYAGKVPGNQLETFIQSNFNDEVLHVEMNSMSNQYLVVYADEEPAGYARITSKGQRPEIFDKKTVARIADFDVLKKFNDIQIKKNLFEKCLSVCSMQQIIWISEYEGNPDLEFFESYGFKKNTEITGSQELALTPVYLVKDKEIN
jgi:hypothetical protein